MANPDIQAQLIAFREARDDRGSAVVVEWFVGSLSSANNIVEREALLHAIITANDSLVCLPYLSPLVISTLSVLFLLLTWIILFLSFIYFLLPIISR